MVPVNELGQTIANGMAWGTALGVAISVVIAIRLEKGE